MNKSGRITTLAIGFYTADIRITQDNHAWIAAGKSLLRYDLSQNSITSLSTFTQHIFVVEVYGSRRIVGNQKPASPNTVTVNVQSRNPIAAGASYILAASSARRSGMTFSNRERLDLDVAHPLFYLSAQNLAPKMFVNFQGKLDSKGNADAKVDSRRKNPEAWDRSCFCRTQVVDSQHAFRINPGCVTSKTGVSARQSKLSSHPDFPR